MAYLTYFDLVEGLITASYGGPQDAEQRDIRQAVQRAYDEVTTIRDWSYYSTHARITTSPGYTTGTLEMTSGTVTLTGGSFATAGLTADNAAYWAIRVANRIYPIKTYNSATSVTVADTFDGVPIPAGSQYAVYKSTYPLPDDFRNLDEPSDEFNWWSGLYVSPDQAMKIARISHSVGKPYHWTIIKDPAGEGFAIQIVGYPNKTESIDYVYRRRARPMRYSGHEANSRAGTIARSVSTVTLSGATTFVSGFVGAVLRVGDTANFPGGMESLTPYASESKITAVASSSSLTTESSGTIAATTKYLITDPADVSRHMYTAVSSGAEYWLARIRGANADKPFALYQRDLRLALEQDQLTPLSGRSRQVWHSGGWRAPLMPDQG